MNTRRRISTIAPAIKALWARAVRVRGISPRVLVGSAVVSGSVSELGRGALGASVSGRSGASPEAEYSILYGVPAPRRANRITLSHSRAFEPARLGQKPPV